MTEFSHDACIHTRTLLADKFKLMKEVFFKSRRSSVASLNCLCDNSKAGTLAEGGKNKKSNYSVVQEASL